MNQVGEHLAVRSGIAVHGEIWLAFDADHKISAQPVPQSLDDLLGHLAEIKASPVRNVAIGRNLLERLYQIDRVIEVDHDLRCRLAARRNEFSQGRPAHAAAGDIGFKSIGLVQESRGDGQAGTDGGVEFVSDARHQPSQRGQLFGLYEAVLRGAEILERLRQLPRALLDLGEQPRVLDGDDRLTGEGFQELDLRLGK